MTSQFWPLPRHRGGRKRSVPYPKGYGMGRPLERPAEFAEDRRHWLIVELVYGCGSWATRERWHDFREARSWAIEHNETYPESPVRVFKYVCRQPVLVFP